MLEKYIAFKAELLAINPWLPFFADVGIYALALLIAAIPIMFLSWLLHYSVKDIFQKVRTYLKSCGQAIDNSVKKTKLRIQKEHSTYYANNQFRQEIPDPAYPELAHPVFESINQLKETIERAPSIAANHENQKQALITSLNHNLESLGEKKETAVSIRVPELQQSAEGEAKKRRAWMELLLFSPLLIAAITINTGLLNLFFRDLFTGYPAYYPIGAALMFSLIEAGIGLNVALLETNKKAAQTSSYITAMLIVGCLLLIELALYLMVGVRFGDEYDSVGEAFSTGEYLSIFLDGGWFALLGPAIVLALFVMGHRVGIAYFNFTNQSQLNAFKKELDKAFEKATETREHFSSADESITELLDEIKQANITLDNLPIDKPDKIKEFEAEIRDILSDVEAQIEKVENIPIALPEVKQIPVSKAEAENLARINSFYLILLLCSIFTMWLLIAGGFTLVDASNNLFSSVKALLVCLTTLAIGFSLSSKVEVIRTDKSEIATLTVTKPKVWTFIAAIIGLLMVGWYLSQSLSGPLEFSLAAIAVIACYFCGVKIKDSISNWALILTTLIQWVWILIMLAGRIVVATLSISVSIIGGILEILSKPPRLFFNP